MTEWTGYAGESDLNQKKIQAALFNMGESRLYYYNRIIDWFAEKPEFKANVLKDHVYAIQLLNKAEELLREKQISNIPN